MSEPSQYAAVRRPTTRSHPSGLLPDFIAHAAEPPERGVPRPVPDTPRHRLTSGESAGMASISVTVVCAGPLELTLARRAGSVAAAGRYAPVPSRRPRGRPRSDFESDRAPGVRRRPCSFAPLTASAKMPARQAEAKPEGSGWRELHARTALCESFRSKTVASIMGAGGCDLAARARHRPNS